MLSDESANPFIPQNVTVVVNISWVEPTRSARSTVTCFRCGEKGHYRAECHGYRVKMCNDPDCTDKNCRFAHTPDQLRQPWLPKCVRVMKDNGCVRIYGCGRMGHTFRCCPYRSPYDQSVGTTRTTSDPNLML